MTVEIKGDRSRPPRIVSVRVVLRESSGPLANIAVEEAGVPVLWVIEFSRALQPVQAAMGLRLVPPWLAPGLVLDMARTGVLDRLGRLPAAVQRRPLV